MFTLSPLPLRHRLTWLAAFACLLAAAPAVRAQRGSTPAPVDAATVLSTLKDLKAKQGQMIGREKQGVMGIITAAQVDPAKSYEQAVIAVEFQGSSNDSLKLVEWHKKQSETLRNPAFVNGLRLLLGYINLTWQRSMGAKNKDLLAVLYDYTNQVAATGGALDSFEVFKRPLGSTTFVKYFQIGPYIANMDAWSDQPFDVEDIYLKTILPTLRDLKDPRVLDYWTGKINGEAARIDKGNNMLAVNKFNNVRRPELLWSRAEDELIIGNRDSALANMLDIVKAHPDHPDFGKWADRLTELVAPDKAGAASGTPAPAPAPATIQ